MLETAMLQKENSTGPIGPQVDAHTRSHAHLQTLSCGCVAMLQKENSTGPIGPQVDAHTRTRTRTHTRPYAWVRPCSRRSIAARAGVYACTRVRVYACAVGVMSFLSPSYRGPPESSLWSMAASSIVCVCVRACVRACVYACACVFCVRACA